ncbi:SRPBCC family protein [Paraglaciecola sp.]|uniref:SRPBCC family protein n=1 Tax=Paraglaciecola sp. TaxID=1920173 RepID=UPI0030F424B6
MQRTITIVNNIVILFMYFTTSKNVLAQEWQLEKYQDHTQVFSRENTNIQESTNYKEILAITLVNASPLALLNLLNDIKRAPQWIDNCIEVNILSNKNEDTKIVKSTFSAPWPLLNRDMVTKSTIEFADKLIVINITDAGNLFPQQQKTVRMTDVQGSWTVKSINRNSIEIRYQGSGNPAGNIPVWLANKVLIDSTFKTFINLSKIITDDRYQ